MNTGARIQEFRKMKGMTQSDLAAKIGTTPQNISQYERGIRNPKIETLQKIAAALEVEIIDLIDDSVSEISDFLLNVQGLSKKQVDEVIRQYNAVLKEAHPEDNVMVSMDGTVILEATGAHVQDISNRFRGEQHFYWWTEKIEAAMKSMNQIGQQKAVEQVEDLAKIPDYQKKPGGE